MITPNPRGAALLLASTLLTACGGGSDAPPPDVRVFHTGATDSIAARTGANTRAAATAFTAQAAGLDHTWDDGDDPTDGTSRMIASAPADPEVVTYRIWQTAPDAAPTVAITFKGTTTTFEPDTLDAQSGVRHRHDAAAPDNLDDQYLWTWDGALSDYAEGDSHSKYLIPIGIYFDADPNDQRRYAVIGLETPPGDRPVGTGTYEGRAVLSVWPKDSSGAAVRDPESRFGMDIALTADFTAGTLQGTLDNWRVVRENGQDLAAARDRPGTAYDVTGGTITNAGFTARIVPGANCSDCVPVTRSRLAGTFYGPDAVETGGTLAIEDADTVALGVFFTPSGD